MKKSSPTATRQWKKWVAAFDTHGSHGDPEAQAAFFKFVRHWKPDIRLHGGDCFDFSPLRKRADAHERRDSMAQDVAAGQQFLQQFRPHVYLRGNHCERLWDLAQQGEGVCQDYAKLIIGHIESDLRKMGTLMLPYNKRSGVYSLGSLKVFHGFRCGLSAARMSAKTYGSCLFGHIHQVQMSTIEGLEPRTGFVSGCLAKLDMDYSRHQEGALTHEHGWAYGVVDLKSGAFQCWLARKVGGQWLLPTGFEIL